ncbi:MAG TPA: FUSC family protein, partial [Bordetella sp.]|nr:FUSC family protein [Bordetella sp.]
HKLALRIVGCLIGAGLGIASIVFLMPHMTSVGAIMLLVFIGTFVSAWIWVGNERVSYAGVQVALAFLLTVLQGSGPTFDMDTARDRVMGILLGNCVLYIVVTQLWPVSVRERIRDCLHQALTHLGAMARMAPPGQSVQDARDLRVERASKAAANIADMRQALGLAQFDIYRQRLSGAELRRVVSAARTVRQAISRLMLYPPNDAGQAERLQMLANRAMQMSAGPKSRAHGLPVRHATASGSGNTLDHDIHRLETLINGR